jgi:aspartate kinase
MKFGGSSLAAPAQRDAAAARVVAALKSGDRPVVVVSAMGRRPDPYATDTLLELAPDAHAGPNRDLLAASGEIVSAAVFAQTLEHHGVQARALTGWQAGILTDGAFGDAHVLLVEPGVIEMLLAQGITPVICGFQGADRDGAITTLGRGGSDLTAVAIARALGCAVLDIYTDVDGVMTADPRRVPSAQTIPNLTFEEVTELSQHGATVMHGKAADLARIAHLPYTVRGLRSGTGTTVGASDAAEPTGPVTGVTASFGFTFMHLVPDAAVLPGGWEQDAFRVLAEDNISIDCVNVNSAGLFFIVRDSEVQRAQERLSPLPLAVRTRPGCAKISVVGAGMRGTPGVMYACVRALSVAGVPIVHSTDSHITISLLVPATNAAAAENALHEYFGLGAPREEHA